MTTVSGIAHDKDEKQMKKNWFIALA